MKQIASLLRQKQIYATQGRIDLLRYFMEENKVFELQAISKRLQPRMDRTTLFRTLHLFAQKKIIQRIPSPDKHPRYIFIATASVSMNTIVICNKCRRIFYGESELPPNLSVPGGFVCDKTRIVIEGECGKC